MTLTGPQEGKLSQNPSQEADLYKIYLLVDLQILCMYSWRELGISSPNLLPCRAALVYKTKAAAPYDALG